MLQLRNIRKSYQVGDFVQDALKDVSIDFRDNEFVSVLGQSGSGKTTLLNIIGGLDRYNEGDLIINGKSTKEYKDRDWDFYRNNSIGFVFQSYNLIGHQSVLSNVELALTLAGVSKKERKERAKEALEKVGLGDHINKRPNQLSGGQMQRVAIARALVNDPDILLADEPTGALDTDTSGQIMELLKEVAEDRLVIMVTHNPVLAERYSTRIVRLRDGEIISDSNPVSEEEMQASRQAHEEAGEAEKKEIKKKKKSKKNSMSFLTALGLSFNNLRTKMGRTILTAFAGSIGIIGIALILSLSTGIQTYINTVQQETLASYPIAMTEQESPWASLFQETETEEQEDGKVYSDQRMESFFEAFYVGSGRENNLTDFKQYFEEEMKKGEEYAQQDQEIEDPEEADFFINEDGDTIWDAVATYQYQYKVGMNTYVIEDEAAGNSEDAYRSTDLMDAIQTPQGLEGVRQQEQESYSLWTELLPNKDRTDISPVIYDQYEVVEGKWPSKPNEVALVLDENNTVPDMAFYEMGFISEEEVDDIIASAENGEATSVNVTETSYQDILDASFKLLLNVDHYVEDPDGTWRDIRDEEASMQLAIENGYDLDMVGIIRPKEDANAQSIQGNFVFIPALTNLLIEETRNSKIVQDQLAEENENLDVFTGLPFEITDNLELSKEEKAEEITEYFDGLEAVEKAVVYEEILGTPSEEEENRAIENVLSGLENREDMVAMIGEALNLSTDQARDYLEDYTDQELEDLISEFVRMQTQAQFEESATVQIYQIKAQAGEEGMYGEEGIALVAQAFDEQIGSITDVDQLAELYDQHMPNVESDSSLEENLDLLAVVDKDSPQGIQIYANDFADKDTIDAFITDYNQQVAEEDQIEYTDYVGLIMSSVTLIINAITYGLIAFVSISLIVSSIMIGIITYISVLERTKEIGVLRSLGASKKDVSRVFNAETFIIGLTSGLIGIAVTLILNVGIRALLEHSTGLENLAILPVPAAIILIIISVLLTTIAGIIPSKMAANKDPVTALRSE